MKGEHDAEHDQRLNKIDVILPLNFVCGVEHVAQGLAKQDERCDNQGRREPRVIPSNQAHACSEGKRSATITGTLGL